MIKNLKKIRNEHRISQQKLGDIVGVSQQSINKYENHADEPDLQTLISIADYFDVSVDYLIGHTDIPHVIEHLTPHDLNDDESMLIEHYRKLTVAEKDSIKFVISNYLLNR